MIVWIVIGVLAALLAVRFAMGMAHRRSSRPPDDVAPVDPGTLARYGAPEVAEMLEEQGRGHELHGLGFRDRR